MRAAVIDPRAESGSPIRLAELPAPEPRDGQVLVRVHAVALSAWERRLAEADQRTLTRSARRHRVDLGLEFSGVVAQSAGPFVVGQRVMGGPHLSKGDKALAEYVTVAPEHLVAIPDSLEYGAAAVLPVAGETALRCVEAARVAAGHRVLVVGAAGGVGINVVQMAAARGAEVHAVARASAAAHLRDLGAAVVHDRAEMSVDDLPGKFDAIVDTSGTLRFGRLRAHLTDRGAFVLTDPQKDPGGLTRAALSRRRMPLVYVPQPTAAGMRRVLDLVSTGALNPQVEASYPLEEIDRAIQALVSSHRLGRIVVEL